MIGSTGSRMQLEGPGDPLVMELEKRLGSLIGVLSKYIVERSYSQVTGNGHDRLDLESARSMCSSIIEEATILLGPKRQHGFHHPRVHSRGGRVVQVYRSLR